MPKLVSVGKNANKLARPYHRPIVEGKSTRHLDDIEGILRVSGPELDLAYVHREAARIGVFGVWRELLERSNLRRRGVTSRGGG